MPTETALKKVGTFTAACVLVSNAVGSGIFTTTGFMARDLGAYILICLWIAGHAILERPTEALLSLATIAAGIPFYLY